MVGKDTNARYLIFNGTNINDKGNKAFLKAPKIIEGKKLIRESTLIANQ